MDQYHFDQLEVYYQRAIDKNYQQYIKEDRQLKQKLQELVLIVKPQTG